MADEFLIEKRDGIATLLINRPEVRNALTADMWARLPDLIDGLNADRDLRVIVVRGAGRQSFAAGADISRFGEERSDPDQVRAYQAQIAAGMASIERSPKAVIAMIYGFAIGGGCHLAAACDLRIMADTAKIGITSARLGIVIGLRETRRLIWLVGPANAREILMTGRAYPAQEALRIGLANAVVPEAELEQYTYDLAAQIAANAPISVAGAKASVLACLEDPTLSNPGEIAELPAQAVLSADHKEGVRAFLEKRKPRFTGE